jgi:hypothetical protein
MQRDLICKRKKKIRRLWQEHRELRSAAWSLKPPKKVSPAQIRDESEILEERRNVQLARSLLNEGVGGEPQSWSAREIKQMKWRRSQDIVYGTSCPEAPFKELEENTYRRSPELHSYYKRVYDYAKGQAKRGPSDKYSLLSEYLTGWSYSPPIVKPRFSPEARSRRAEIQRRIVEISGMEYRTAVRVVHEEPGRNPDAIPDRRKEIQETFRRRDMRKEVKRSRVDLLEERRDEHRYWEKIGAADREREELEGQSQRAYAFEETSEAAEEKIDDYRRLKTQVPIEEKISA